MYVHVDTSESPPTNSPKIKIHLKTTASDGGACTLLVPMDRSTVSSTIYMHERFEDAEAGKGEQKIKWRPVGKAPKVGEGGGGRGVG